MATTIKLSVQPFASWVDIEATFAVGTTGATIERRDPGAPWVFIRAGAVIEVDPLTGKAFYQDHEAPMDVPVQYRAVQIDPVPDVEVISGYITLTSYDKVWLKDPAFGSYDMELQEVTNIPELNYAARAGVFAVIDREDPVVVAARRQSWTGDLQLSTRTDAERTNLESMLQRGQILLLSVPPRYGIGNVYVHVGNVTQSRIGLAMEPSRAWVLPMTCVDRPIPLGYVPLGMHWIDVYYKYTTWKDLVDTGQTWKWLAEEDTPI